MGRLKYLVAAMLLVPGPVHAAGWADSWADAWWTPDQQGRRLEEQGEHRAAAERYRDPARRGAAWFRAGEFEQAAAEFGRLQTPEGAFNRGNSLVMLGRYEEAMASYDRALSLRPDWREAADNHELARLRKEKLAPAEDDHGGTGGKLGADEIRFDDSGRVDKAGSTETTEGGEALSDQEMRAVWLRRVEGDPGDFLAARFAYQLYRDTQAEGDDATD